MSKPILNKWNGIKEDTEFDSKYFLEVDMGLNTTDTQQACHTCALGSITVLDRLTGYEGYVRDVETGYRDLHGEFWLASCNFNILDENCETFGEAIALIKERANNCVGKEHDEKFPIQRAKKAEERVKELEQKIQEESDCPEINRLEIIGPEGRMYFCSCPLGSKPKVVYQDGCKTMKIFLRMKEGNDE